MRLPIILLALLASVCGWAADPVLGLGPLPPGSGVFSGGAAPANTQVAYSNGSTLTGDSGFVRSSLALTVDPNTDNTFQTGYGIMGFVPSGVSGNFYIAKAVNFTTSNYALQAGATNTFINCPTGGSVFFRVNDSNKVTLTSSSMSFGAGVPVTISDTTEATTVSAASTIVVGGLGVAKRSFLGTIGATFSGNVEAGVQNATAVAAGQVGEVIVSNVSTYTNYTTTATIQQVTSIALTAGDWMEYATVTYFGNAATNAADGEFVSYLCDTTASATGAVEGETLVYQDQPITGSLHRTVTMSLHENIGAAKTKFLNSKCAFTVGNPQFVCSLKAVRIR